MFINEDDKQKVLDRSEGKLLEVISDFINLRQTGASYVGTCPKCGSGAFTVTPGKGIFTCFSCKQVKGKKPLDYLLTGEGKTFPEALKYLAEHFGILLTEAVQPVTPIKTKSRPKTMQDVDSFCAKMLAESGLTHEDVIATVYKVDDERSIFKSATFSRGTLKENGDIDNQGDDVIIKYFDLDGFPITYTLKDSKSREIGKREYFRVRWQYPEEHKDKNGRPAKYRSPMGAGSPVYIPEKVRSAFKNKQEIPRLFIQEGEKKAEKACKHGIMSLGIAGIQNMGYDGKLPESVAKIVEICKVKEVVFLLDADCFDLTTHLKINEPVEKRPRNFFYAVKNFKEYFNILKNRELYVEIYFGYVLKNEAGDKGVDDLLSNTLKNKEPELLNDIEYAINLKEMKGKHIQLHKITSIPDSRILEIWSLQSPKTFCEKYYSELKNLPEFLFGKHKWRFNENGEFETAQPLESDEQYWIEKKKYSKDGSENMLYEFKYSRCFKFLSNRGFGRHRRSDGAIEFIHLEHPFLKTIPHIDVRDYLVNFTKAYANEEVLEMLYRGGPQYLGPDKLSYLEYIHPAFETASREKQNLYFKSCYWEINPNGIQQRNYDQVHFHIWSDARKDFDASITPELILVNRDKEGRFSYSLSDKGRKCHFLRFLENTSNFTWRKEKMLKDGIDVSITAEERYENIQHMVAKLCAIGYLATSMKDASVAKAVVGVDGKQSEVGISNGRSGKSLIGELLKRTVITQYINGKTVDITRDTFVWTEVTEKTKLVFIDDVRRDFPFEMLFANITGDWSINYKNGGRCTIPFKDSPKIYITSNHMLSGDGSSFQDRQWCFACSDFYNEDHKPVDDFGCMFFDEWDYEQWNLTWNFIAQCIQIYFKYGCIESPGERIEMRKLRQELGEEFIMWADEYFSDDKHRNIRLCRKDMYENLISILGERKRQFYTPTSFKRRIQKYCKFKGYLYNPHKYDPVSGEPMFYDKDGRPVDDDKSGGMEYFMVADPSYSPVLSNTDPFDSIFKDDLPDA